MTAQLTVAVAIATAGRTAILTETLVELARQVRRPDVVVICPAEPCDADRTALAALDLDILYTTGSKGASAQRNAMLKVMPDVDIVLFLDDDFFIGTTFCQELVALFASDDSIALATGTLIADGIHGPGFDPAAARAMLSVEPGPASARLETVFNGYGCNMAVRWSAIAHAGLRFDENLPLYSWAEDVEYSRQVARFGRLVKSNRLVGVHLGSKRGRTSGIRLGYSQVANQAYLSRKGVITTKLALLHVVRNVLANILGTIHSEAYIDRRGRLLGNIYGVLDLIRGRSSPGRILDL